MAMKKNRDLDQYIALYRNDTRYGRSYYGNASRNSCAIYRIMLFPMNWVTLSDLAKYSMARSIVRSLCASWTLVYFLIDNRLHV